MLSEKPWNRELLLVLVAGLLISWCLGMVVAILMEKFLPVNLLAEKSFYHFLISTLTFHVATLVLVHQFLRLNGTNWKEFLGLTRPRVSRAIIFAAIAGLVILPVIWTLNDWSARLLNSLGSKAEPQPAIKVLESTVGVGQRVCFGVAAIVLAPLAEESLFRGIFYPFIKQQGRPVLAVFGTSLLFAAFHVSLTTFIPLAFFAVILIAVYEKTAALLAPIVMHALFNALNLLAAFFGPELQEFYQHWFHR